MNQPGQESTTGAVAAPVPSQAPPEARDRRTWLVAIPLVLIVIYALIPALVNGFMPSLDDNGDLIENPYIRGLGAAQVKWAWSTTMEGLYHPLTWMLFEAQYVLWQLDGQGYHLTSLLLHVANAFVLYVLTVALLARCRNGSCLESPWICSLSAGLATALFAVHPLRVEVVAWASVQKYLSCALFSMLSVLAYLRSFPRDSCEPRWGWLVGSFLLFVAALLFLPAAVSLPAVLLILDVYPLRRLPDSSGRWFGASARRALLEKVPFVMVSLLFMGVAITVRGQSPFLTEHYDVSEGIAQACYGIWFYILKTVLPLNLTALYLLPLDLNWLKLPFSLSILATLAVSVGLFLLHRRWPGMLAAWLGYLVILAPNSGIIRGNRDVIAADRYSYMAMLALVMLAAGGFCRLWRISSRWRPVARIGIITMGLGVLLALLPMTRNQCRTWRDPETFWAHAFTSWKDVKDLPLYNLGVLLQNKGRSQAAVADDTETPRLNPANDLAHNNLGSVLYSRRISSPIATLLCSAHDNLGSLLYSRGKYAEAEAHFAEAARLHPGDDKVRNKLGKVLFAQAKDEEAVAQFTESLRLNPALADAHNNLGVVLDKHGNNEAAAAQFTEAVRLDPGLADAHNNLGSILSRRGSYEAAEVHFVDAVRLNPGDDKAHNNLAKILSKRGKFEEAGAHFTEALRLNPGSVDAYYNLGLVLSHLGNYGAAASQFAEAMRLQPGDPRSYNAGAMMMAACPEAKFRDGKKAVQFATRACELTEWKNSIILDTLAAAQAEAGDFVAAVKWQLRAIELLTDGRQKADYRARLALYQAKRPYREVSHSRAPTAARP